MPVIAYTSEDAAGSNIATRLCESYGFEEKNEIVEGGFTLRNWECARNRKIKIVELNTRLAKESEYVSQLECFESDLVVFASRHRAESGTPSFTVHSTGNWGGDAQWGGRPQELGTTNARAIACAFRWLKKNGFNGFEVSLEATHHGPTSLSSPSLFVELGSSEKEWVLSEPAKHVAKCVMHVCENYESETGEIALGFGGTHYASKFNELELEQNCFSFIAPKYVLDGVDSELVKQAVEKTVEKTDCAVLDWKGTNQGQREKLKSVFGGLGLEWKRV